MIQGLAPSKDEEKQLYGTFKSVYEQALEIYGLIHSMYVCSQASEQAIEKVKSKFQEEKAYGVCPRVQCGG